MENVNFRNFNSVAVMFSEGVAKTCALRQVQAGNSTLKRSKACCSVLYMYRM